MPIASTTLKPLCGIYHALKCLSEDSKTHTPRTSPRLSLILSDSLTHDVRQQHQLSISWIETHIPGASNPEAVGKATTGDRLAARGCSGSLSRKSYS